MSNASPVPPGHHTVAPYLVVDDAAQAIEFYTRAFGARELFRMPGPDGRIMHGEFTIGDSPIMISDSNAEIGAVSAKTLKGSPVSIFLYVDSVDELFARAVTAGATVQLPVTDMFWGDRYAQVVDPFGLTWQLATHVEDVSPDEMTRRMTSMAG